MRLLANVIQRLLYRRIATSHEALGRSLRAHVRDLNASTRSTSLSRLGGALIGLHFVVVTLNAAVVLDRKALLARFRHLERQKEEVHFESTFRALQRSGLIDCIR